MEVVVTGTRTPESMQRSTVRTGVVTREEAERRGAQTVADALSGEPGLQVNPRAYDYLGSPSGVMMQGLDAERVLVLRDGEPMIGDSGGVMDLAQFSVGDIDRVEYVLGPSSSLYGAGALGGVVNIITGGPEADGLSARTRLEATTLPEYFAVASTGYRRGIYWAGASLSYRTTGGVRLFADRPELALAPQRRWEAAARIGSDEPAAISRLEVHLAENHSRGLSTQQAPGLGDYLIDLPDSTRRLQLRLRQIYQLRSNARLRISTSGQLFSGESRKDRRNSRLDEIRQREQRLLSMEGTLTMGRPGATFVLGARAQQEDFDQQLMKKELVGVEVTSSTVTEIAPVNLRSLAGYAQVGWRLGEDLTLLPGMRCELHRRFGVVVAPRMAVAYRPWSGWSMRASGGRGFRTPSAKEYGFLFDHSFLGYRVIGNPDLDPERSWGINMDVTLPLSRRVRLQVAGFRNWVRSLISTQLSERTLPGVDDYTYVNVGAATTMGGDISVGFDLMPRVSSQVAYSYLLTRNEDTGKPLQSRPSHTALSALTYRAFQGLELMFRNRWVSSAYVSDEVRAPGFLTLDVRVAQRLGNSFQVYGGILNALNSREDPTRPGDQRPIVGRVYVLGLNGNFEEQR